MKKIILFVFLLLIAINVSGQTNEKTESTSKQNLAISRQIFWDSIPKPLGWTNDYEAIFSDAEEEKLNNLIANFEKETTIEIGIITIDTVKTSKDKFDALSLHIARTWGVGKKGKDNGILIGLSKGYRKIRIELGNGISKVISDEEAKEIINNYFIPEFKKGNYYQGMLNGITEIMERLRVKITKQ